MFLESLSERLERLLVTLGGTLSKQYQFLISAIRQSRDCECDLNHLSLLSGQRCGVG